MNKYFYMKSKELKITKILFKTKAKMFGKLKIGDKIQCSVPIYAPGSNKGTYATYITVTNLQTSEKISKSFNQLASILGNFELEEIQNNIKEMSTI